MRKEESNEFLLEEKIELHNELSTYEDTNKRYKFQYEEGKAKEIFLKGLTHNEYSHIEKESNKNNLKCKKEERRILEKQIHAKCIKLYKDNKLNDELAQRKILAQTRNTQLKEMLTSLRTDLDRQIKEQLDKETITNKLLQIEDKINEKEKIENIDPKVIEKYIQTFDERKMMYENYMDGLDENTCDILQQERHYMHNKGLVLMETILCYKIVKCKKIDDKIRIHIMSNFYSMYIYISEERICDIKVFDYKGNQEKVNEIIDVCKRKNNPLYLLCYLHKK